MNICLYWHICFFFWQEIVSPEGAIIFTKQFELGDPSLSTVRSTLIQSNLLIGITQSNLKFIKSFPRGKNLPRQFSATSNLFLLPGFISATKSCILYLKDEEFNFETFLLFRIPP